MSKKNKCAPVSVSLNPRHHFVIEKSLSLSVKRGLLGTSRSEIIQAAILHWWSLPDSEKVKLINRVKQEKISSC